jgi:hypothetical protein
VEIEVRLFESCRHFSERRKAVDFGWKRRNGGQVGFGPEQQSQTAPRLQDAGGLAQATVEIPPEVEHVYAQHLVEDVVGERQGFRARKDHANAIGLDVRPVAPRCDLHHQLGGSTPTTRPLEARIASSAKLRPCPQPTNAAPVLGYAASGLAYCVGGRSIWWGGWSPRLLDTETRTDWPQAVLDDLNAKKLPNGDNGYFRQSGQQIGDERLHLRRVAPRDARAALQRDNRQSDFRRGRPCHSAGGPSCRNPRYAAPTR